MNKFVQFLVALCAFVWLIIGSAIIVGGIVLAIVIAKTKPFEQISQFAPLLQMGTGTTGTKGSVSTQGQFQGQSIEQLISTPAFQSCAVSVLGQARVAALMREKQLPSALEMLRLSVCLSPQKAR